MRRWSKRDLHTRHYETHHEDALRCTLPGLEVTIEYLQRADGSVEPKKIHTVVISTQHCEPLKRPQPGLCAFCALETLHLRTRRVEVAGYTGPDETAPSMEDGKQCVPGS